MGKSIYGLIGYPVKHSFSPAMHNAAFGALGIEAEYRLFEVKPEELNDFLLNPTEKVKDTQGDIFYAKDISGFNITIPHKVRAKDILSSSSIFKNEEPYYTELSGAINTVKREGSGGYYWNTDVYGFEHALCDDLHFEPQGNDNVMVMGCGGVGRVIISLLSKEDLGINKIYIYDKNKDAEINAENYFSKYFLKYPYIKGKLEFIARGKIPEVIRQCRLLVNASSAGMKEEDDNLIDKKLLHDNLFVYDVVYNRETKLVKDAKEICRGASSGLGMLLYQGARALSLWIDNPAPIDVMRGALKRELNK